MVTQTACNTDKCKDKDCGNGICLEDGACECDPGWEYDANGECKVASTDKFVGTWKVTEVCTGDPMQFVYDVAITKGATASDIQISNFFDSFTTSKVNATVSGNVVTIPVQKPANGDLQVSGTGTLNTATTMTLDYTITDLSVTPNLVVTCGPTQLVKQ